jgi:hypothetical protein
MSYLRPQVDGQHWSTRPGDPWATRIDGPSTSCRTKPAPQSTSGNFLREIIGSNHRSLRIEVSQQPLASRSYCRCRPRSRGTCGSRRHRHAEERDSVEPVSSGCYSAGCDRGPHVSIRDVMRAARHDAMTLGIIDTAPHAASDAARVAKRNKWPARFLTFRAPRHSSFPPLMSLSGQSASHETKCATGWPHVSDFLIIICGFRLNWGGDEISEGAGMATARQERATIQSPIPLKHAWNATSARGSHLSPWHPHFVRFHCTNCGNLNPDSRV